MFLGLDFSTQQLKAIILACPSGTVLVEEHVSFDVDLPNFKTTNGVHQSPTDPSVVTAPTLMWIEALDLLFQKLKAKQEQNLEFSFRNIKAIGGAGQQHGSVFWQKGSQDKLWKKLDPTKPLSEQLKDRFARKDSPIWMDSSTHTQCLTLEKAAGGPLPLALITGSRAFERFTGPQIMKFIQNESDLYNQVERISLVSSLAASLLLQQYAPIDAADGSGMNLMDLKSRTWDRSLLESCACGDSGAGRLLEDKLGQVKASDTTIIGKIDKYFVERYGFDPECKVSIFTGDNPAGLACLLFQNHHVSVPPQPSPSTSSSSSSSFTAPSVFISLGTSDTIFLSLSPETKSLIMNPLVGHRFAHPQLPDAEMALICYKNGSLCREWIRNKYCEGTWDKFEEMVRNAAAASTSTNNTNSIGFYFPQKEISPKVEGVFRFQKQQGSSSEFDLVAEFSDPTVTPLTLLESQFLGMRIDCLSLGIDISSSSSASRVYVSGGASQNATLLQIMANCFDTQVWCVEGSTSAAAFGGAVRAWYATEHAADSSLGFEHFCQKYAVGTDRKADVYRPLLASRERYAQLFKNVQRLRSGNVVQMGAW